jgi:hypothetical protein
LFLRPGAGLDSLKLEDLRAAALYYEIRGFGLATGIFSTDDRRGLRTVIAPLRLRTEVTALAVVALMRRGAHVVLTSYQSADRNGDRPGPMLQPRSVLWAERIRVVRKQMLLKPTYDETLAEFGKKTRTQLRYYRKRLLTKTDCEFVPDAKAVLSEAEFVALSARSLNPILASEARRRYQACALPGAFMIGLRAAGGEWLSIIGGWRQGTATVMHHQVNSGGYEKDSICTVMRSFLLETEIARGARKLIFYGGTRHPMSHAFECEEVRDLIVRRRSVWANLLRAMARYLVSDRFSGSNTFLVAALSSPDMEWKSVDGEGPALAGVVKGDVALLSPGGPSETVKKAD